MTWLAFLPPVLSIYLILISPATDLYLKRLVRAYSTDDACLDKTRDAQIDIASDWESRTGFINSMAISLISIVSVYMGVQSIYWVAATAFGLVVVFVPMLYWILSDEIGDLVDLNTRAGWAHNSICRAGLLVVYVLLIIETAFSQGLFVPVSSLPK